MPIHEIINPIPKDQDRKIDSDLFLSLKTGIQDIVKAIRVVKKEWINGLDPESGEIQVLYPVPVLRYSRDSTVYEISVWVHGGNEDKARRLYDVLKNYSHVHDSSDGLI